MKLTVNELMSAGVVVARPDHTVEYVRNQMRTLEIRAVPVAEDDGAAVGLVQSRHLIGDLAPDTPVHEIMETEYFTVESGTDVKTAARIMRQKRRNHLVITDGGTIKGILSSFDFLALVENAEIQEQEDSAFQTGVFQTVQAEDRAEE